MQKRSPSMINRSDRIEKLSACTLQRRFPLIHNIFRSQRSILKLLNSVSQTTFLNVSTHALRSTSISRSIREFITRLTLLRSSSLPLKPFLPLLILTLIPAHALSHNSPPGLNHNKAGPIIKHMVRTDPHSIQREDFSCPAGAAQQVQDSTNRGGYVRCEDWDAYQALMLVGEVESAALLLLRTNTAGVLRLQQEDQKRARKQSQGVSK